MSLNNKFKLQDERGSNILSAVVATTLLGVIAVGVGSALFGVGRMKVRTQAKATLMDYEKAFSQSLGQQAMNYLSSCNNAFPKNVSLNLGDLGSVSNLSGPMRTELGSKLSVDKETTQSLQLELNNTFKACPEEPTNPSSSSPGVYMFCVGFQGNNGASFQGMLGVFAQVRLDLSLRSRNASDRILGSAVTCDLFKTTSQPESREIKISYKLYFKKFEGEMGIFTKTGSAVYSP